MNPEFDIIEGVRVCRLRPAPASTPPADRATWVWLGVILFGSASASVLGGFAADPAQYASARLPFLYARLFCQLAAIAFVFGFLISTIRRYARQRQAEIRRIASTTKPPGMPDAEAVFVNISDGSRCGGWFWFDGPWARFRGERFDFDLNRDHAKLRIIDGRLVFFVRYPGKLGTKRARITLAAVQARKAKDRFAQALRSFEQGTLGDEPVLLPPFLAGSAEMSYAVALRVGLAASLGTLIVYAVAALVSKPSDYGKIATLAMGVVMLGLFPAAVAALNGYQRSSDQKRYERAVSGSNSKPE